MYIPPVVTCTPRANFIPESVAIALRRSAEPNPRIIVPSLVSV